MVEKCGYQSFWFLFGICLEVGATEYIKGTMKVDKKWIEVVARGIPASDCKHCKTFAEYIAMFVKHPDNIKTL